MKTTHGNADELLRFQSTSWLDPVPEKEPFPHSDAISGLDQKQVCKSDRIWTQIDLT